MFAKITPARHASYYFAFESYSIDESLLRLLKIRAGVFQHVYKMCIQGSEANCSWNSVNTTGSKATFTFYTSQDMGCCVFFKIIQGNEFSLSFKEGRIKIYHQTPATRCWWGGGVSLVSDNIFFYLSSVTKWKWMNSLMASLLMFSVLQKNRNSLIRPFFVGSE